MISFLFLSRVASRWLAHRREHAPWKPRHSECSAVWEAPSLKPHQTVSNESLHIAGNYSSSWTIPFEGHLYFRLKQTCFFRGRLSTQQCHAVPQVGVHILPAFPFSWFTPPPFGLFTAESVGCILLGHPPFPAIVRHNLQLSYGVRDEARCSLPAHCILATKRGPCCTSWCSILWRHSPACSVCTPDAFALPCTPGCAVTAPQSPFLFTVNGICSIDPAKALQGLSLQLKVTAPCSVCAQQHIFDGLALHNFHG